MCDGYAESGSLWLRMLVSSDSAASGLGTGITSPDFWSAWAYALLPTHPTFSPLLSSFCCGLGARLLAMVCLSLATCTGSHLVSLVTKSSLSAPFDVRNLCVEVVAERSSYPLYASKDLLITPNTSHLSHLHCCSHQFSD